MSGAVSCSNCCRDFEPVEAGHLNIQEHHIRPQLIDRGSGLQTVLRARHDFDVAQLTEPALQLVPCWRFIIRDEDANHAGRSGKVTFAITESPSFTSCNVASIAVNDFQALTTVAQPDAFAILSRQCRSGVANLQHQRSLSRRAAISNAHRSDAALHPMLERILEQRLQ